MLVLKRCSNSAPISETAGRPKRCAWASAVRNLGKSRSVNSPLARDSEAHPAPRRSCANHIENSKQPNKPIPRWLSFPARRHGILGETTSSA